MKCPVCDLENGSIRCPRCGFDSSRDYGKYPTLAPVPHTVAASALREQRQEKQNPPKPVTPPKPAPKSPPQPPRQATVTPPTADSISKNKWAAFFLCLFLGMFGAHKFYEGQKGMGILYLCTAGIFGYGWLFDCISLICKPNPYFVKTTPQHKK